MRWKAKKGEMLVINSSELRAVQGHQKCDFKLTPPRSAQPLRQQLERTKKHVSRPDATIDYDVEPEFDYKQRWRLARECDRDTRTVCEYT